MHGRQTLHRNIWELPPTVLHVDEPEEEDVNQMPEIHASQQGNRAMPQDPDSATAHQKRHSLFGAPAGGQVVRGEGGQDGDCEGGHPGDGGRLQGGGAGLPEERHIPGLCERYCSGVA